MERQETLNEAAARLDVAARRLGEIADRVFPFSAGSPAPVAAGEIRAVENDIRRVAEFIRKNT